MRQKKLPITQLPTPYEFGISVIEGKWRSRLLTALNYYKAMRYVELRESLKPISDTVLASTLREMIANFLVEKVQLDDSSICYSLTKKGQGLIPILQNLSRWSERWGHECGTPSVCDGLKKNPVNPFRPTSYDKPCLRTLKGLERD